VRSAGVATVVALTFAAAACSSGGGSDRGSRTEICALVADLDDTAATVAGADVADPTAFQQTLDEAVDRYVDTVRDLRPLVPERLHDDLDRLEAAVEQYDFTDASSARRELDTDDATACTASTTTATSD
jgi:hypothetical protein